MKEGDFYVVRTQVENLMNDFTELKERFDSLTGMHQDLMKSIAHTVNKLDVFAERISNHITGDEAFRESFSRDVQSIQKKLSYWGIKQVVAATSLFGAATAVAVLILRVLKV